MASPNVAATSVLQGTASEPSTEFSLSGLGTISSGDLLIFFFDCHSSAVTWSSVTDDGTGDPTFFAPSGEPGSSIKSAWKIAAGDETTVTVTTALGRWKIANLYRITNHAHNGLAPTVGAFASGDSTTPDPSSVTAPNTGKDNLYIAVCGGSAQATVDAAPTNYTSLLANSLGGTSVYLGSAQRALTADSDDPGTFTISGEFVWNAYTICIEGAAGGISIPVLRTVQSNLRW